MELTKQPWGRFEANDINLVKLSNGQIEVTISNFGATITGIKTPDKNGCIDNIVLGYDKLEDYITDEFYTGSIIGRYAGRIADARFSINGASYQLAQNDGDNKIHLHGGNKGFSKRVFTIANKLVADHAASVEFYYRSRHLEEGYPGNLDVWITYKLTADNKLSIKYRAITDSDTHINLTNHTYFNLSGKSQSALNNKLFIDADNYLVIDDKHIPTGDIEPVENTPYNFKKTRAIANGTPYLAGGYNECYVLNKHTNKPCAILSDDATGRKVILETDMPALLFYSGDYLGGKFLKNNGVCLETQYFPDTPNHSDFPSTLLKAGKEWESCTRFTFSWSE